MKDYSQPVRELFERQLSGWKLAGDNYRLLRNVHTRRIDMGKYSFLVQFNPERIRSSAAKVDSSSVAARPCFLCSANRPPEQYGVTFGQNLQILVNPFPIFKQHLTVVGSGHTDQRISGRFKEMLELARALPDYVVFYNGPECGASAPDHFHFQAGNKGFMLTEEDFRKKCCVNLLTEWEGNSVWAWKGYGRGVATLTGNDPASLDELFSGFLAEMAKLQPGKAEPMLNILASFEQGEWIVHLFPRIKHRPVQYFSEGEDKLVLSPASVDLGGVLITPREEDFKKISGEDILDIFSQVCMPENEIPLLFTNYL